MSVPRVYAAITAVIGDLSTNGIARKHVNARDRYEYRSIDDLYEGLSPLLAKHRLCILPRMLKRWASEQRDEQGGMMMSVTVRAAFDLVSAEDGSCHVIKSFGEALDGSDKATAKAMTAAYKSALFQTFCIPVGGPDEADAHSIRLKPEGVVEPAQGWIQWAHELLETVTNCQTGEEVDRVKATSSHLLRALAMHEAELFAKVGERIRERRAELGRSPSPAEPKRAQVTDRTQRRSRAARAKKVAAHA